MTPSSNAYGVDLQDRASFLLVKVDRAENMGLVMNMIDENFHNSESQTETVTESDSIANYVTTIGDLRTIIYSLCVVVLLTSDDRRKSDGNDGARPNG